jgi:hypothetical protein
MVRLRMKLIALTSLICLILIDEGPAKKTQERPSGAERGEEGVLRVD